MALLDEPELQHVGRPVAGMQRTLCGSYELRWLWTSLRVLEFFDGLPYSRLQKLAPAVSLWLFPSYRLVIREGADTEGLFVLYKGRAVVSRHSPTRGCRMPVESLLPGDHFGEIALLDRSYRTATVETTEPSAIFVLQAEQFRAILDENPDLDKRLRRVSEQRKLELRRYA